MATQSFYLVNDNPATARAIILSEKDDLKSLQKTVADFLQVAGKQEIGFQNKERALVHLGEILSNPEPVGVTLDGHGVRQIQGPDGLPAVGSFYEIFPDHLGNHDRLFKKYGSVIKTTNMGKTTYLTNDPAIGLLAFSESQFFTKKITPNHPLYALKDNTALFLGDTETANWAAGHKFIPPCMSPKAVRHYTPLMQDCVRDCFKVFDELDARNESLNVYQYMLKLASGFIGKIVLGLDLHQMDEVDSPIHPMVTSRGDWYARLPFGDPQRLREVRKKLYAMLAAQVDTGRLTTGSDLPLHDAALDAKCVLDYLLRAVDNQGKKLPIDLVYSNIVVISAAGFTTTSSLLSWLLYCLVAYPGNQERLLQELVDHGINEKTQWTPELSTSLHFLEIFVKETQRLHNPSYQPGRTSKTEVILPGGYRLPENEVIIPAIHAIHTNPKIWTNPQRFDPDRWDSEEIKSRPAGSYLPFATGARGCIGFNLALAEVKVLIPELVYRYEFSKDGDEAVEYDPEFQLIRPVNLYVRAKKRTTWPEPSMKA
ncbi:Cytochrome P450 [Lachnellula subtilissima]|uniref:Cytochrome P450 n=1 Tax=Lachnellula subtilissima TaxID=602034 RepID=A0A8H8U5X4_9HELO|nr:Cytochrome P450 [Lachnellula subtilissima]